MAKERIVNLVELGRRPDKVRYLWIVQFKDGSIKSGATWMTLKRVFDEEAQSTISHIKIVDMVTNKIYELLFSEVKTFMDLWRTNYRNFKWNIEKDME